MFLAFYNKEHIGDTLLLVSQETTEPVAHERIGNVTRIYNVQTKETVAYNIFNVSEVLTLTTSGQVLLSDDAVLTINELLRACHFQPITVDNTPKFVIGHVESCEKHPDSDHLHITQVNVGNETLQIVCGAENVAQGQFVVVAKVGAVMPTGQIIWQGQLRGVDSYGMLCSKRELGLEHDPNVKGILVLQEGQVGQPFVA